MPRTREDHWKCRATTVGVLFAGRQRGGKTTASKEAASRSSEGLHNPAAVASGGAHDAEAQGRVQVRPPCREAGVVLRRGPADDAALHASSTTAEDREPPGDEARDGLVGLAGAVSAHVLVVYGPPRPPWAVGLLCWQRQCGAGRHGLNGSFQPRHTADLASISFPNGRG
jgi:hypothetical protein